MPGTITLKTPISDLYGVGDQTSERFAKLGVRTVADLFELLPFRAEDRTNIQPIKALQPGDEAVIAGTIKKVSTRLSKRGALIVQAKIEDESGTIQAVWFNQKYLLKTLEEGQSVLLYGSKKIVPAMSNPFFVKKIIPRLEVAPIYPTTAGLSQYLITRLLERVRPVLSTMHDIVPPAIVTELGLPSRRLALDAAHFSPRAETFEQARSLLGFEELLLLSIQALLAKQNRVKEAIAPINCDEVALQQAKKCFGFALTPGQNAALQELLADLQKPYPMNRLMYGEVGSGKTAIGLLAAAAVCQSGQKVVWLSPTTTLAEQQAKLTNEFCQKIGLRSAFISGARKEAYGEANIIVGTHALLQNQLGLTDIGLVVIDEQQRFGVEQRNYLLNNHPKAHLLMMTATPIPRTLAHTLFGHLDITFLEGKPSQQKPVKTYVFTDSQRQKVEDHVRARIAKNQPGYIICPLIDGSTQESATLFSSERKAITTELKRIEAEFSNSRIGTLHGRMKADEKERIMAAFKNGELDILLATSVVEVGIDNPQATWIIVEEADRFGLSQLHQLRGRVGRGAKESVCFLHNSLTTEQATRRLEVLAGSNNGLEIAEQDLRLRGPGNIAGYEQSGLPDVRYADLSNIDLIKKAYAVAEQLVSEGINNYAGLKEALKRNKRDGLPAV